jgi:N-ethylmaleimide reductase
MPRSGAGSGRIPTEPNAPYYAPRASVRSPERNGRPASTTRYLRGRFAGTVVTAQGYDHERAAAVPARGDADLVAFARLFISNPDLPLRLAIGAPLAAPDRSTFYGGDERGYVDYPGVSASRTERCHQCAGRAA